MCVSPNNTSHYIVLTTDTVGDFHIQPGFLIKFNLREFICKCVCIHRLKEVGVITGDRVTFAPIVGGDMAGADRYDDHSR